MVHFEMRCHQKIFHLKYHKMKLKRCQICNIRFQAKKTFLTQTSLLMMILKISTDPFDLLIHMENCFALVMLSPTIYVRTSFFLEVRTQTFSKVVIVVCEAQASIHLQYSESMFSKQSQTKVIKEKWGQHFANDHLFHSSMQ